MSHVDRLYEEHHASKTETANVSTVVFQNDAVKKPSHYDVIEGVQAIELIARSMTKEQFYGYCLGNIMKYRFRVGKKDSIEQDLGKANQYVELYEKYKGLCYAETKASI